MKPEDVAVIVGLLQEQIGLTRELLAETRAQRLATERLSHSTLTRQDRTRLAAILPPVHAEYRGAWFLIRDVSTQPAVRALKLSPTALGRLFLRAEMQVIDGGFYVERGGEERGSVLWRVEQLGGVDGLSVVSTSRLRTRLSVA